ncbi:MAG: alpha-hydroxy-acid oxidizing protein [Eggerthellaceae bacterium]|jgi:4-hydroxymandelate oxidase
MDWQETMKNARGQMGACKVCPVCDGRGCRNTIPGPGAKGRGDVAIRNYAKWQEIRVNMDTLHANVPVDTSIELFGKRLRLPVMAGPVGAVQLHYADKYTDEDYNRILVPACNEAGIAAFVGDGTNPRVLEAGTASIKAAGGVGIPTVKPWDLDTIREKLSLVADSGAFACAMDIDAAGLPFLQGLTPPAGSKSVQELAAVVDACPVPFIVKGIMTSAAAVKAKQAGAAAIVVSNHGGRVLDGCPATAEVLPAIVDAVGGDMGVLVDGGIRSGLDVFKALALGADAVLVARPFVTAVYGAAEEGVAALIDKFEAELIDTMRMCGAATIADITREMVRLLP